MNFMEPPGLSRQDLPIVFCLSNLPIPVRWLFRPQKFLVKTTLKRSFCNRRLRNEFSAQVISVHSMSTLINALSSNYPLEPQASSKLMGESPHCIAFIRFFNAFRIAFGSPLLEWRRDGYHKTVRFVSTH